MTSWSAHDLLILIVELDIIITKVWTIFFKSEFNMRESETALMFKATKATHKTETSLLQRSNISIGTG